MKKATLWKVHLYFSTFWMTMIVKPNLSNYKKRFYHLFSMKSTCKCNWSNKKLLNTFLLANYKCINLELLEHSHKLEQKLLSILVLKPNFLFYILTFPNISYLTIYFALYFIKIWILLLLLFIFLHAQQPSPTFFLHPQDT